MNEADSTVNTIEWPEVLNLTVITAAHANLLDVLQKVASSGEKKLHIKPASRTDHLARQLVAAAKLSAETLGVEIEVINNDGDWNELTHMEDAA